MISSACPGLVCSSRASRRIGVPGGKGQFGPQIGGVAHQPLVGVQLPEIGLLHPRCRARVYPAILQLERTAVAVVHRPQMDQRVALGQGRAAPATSAGGGLWSLRDDTVTVGHSSLLDLLAHDGDGEGRLVDRVDGDARAGPASAVEETLVGQKLERLVHGRAGGAELDGEICLVRNPVALSHSRSTMLRRTSPAMFCALGEVEPACLSVTSASCNPLRGRRDSRP